MNISYEGIGALVVSIPAGNCEAGKVCKVNGVGKADKCAANDKFCGVVLAVEQGMAAVQMEGFVTVGYTGSMPAYGFNTLAADGNGKVMLHSAGREHMVVGINQSEMKITMKL